MGTGGEGECISMQMFGYKFLIEYLVHKLFAINTRFFVSFMKTSVLLKISALKIFCKRHFFRSNTFISNTRLNLTKNQAKAKQPTEAEFLLFENYSLSSSALSSKNNEHVYSKKCAKKKKKASVPTLMRSYN